jgi:hypothetical protein
MLCSDLRPTRGAQAFDPTSENYGHGNNKTGNTKKSVLHPDLKTIPRVPQVQLIGNGTVYDHEGLAEVSQLYIIRPLTDQSLLLVRRN